MPALAFLASVGLVLLAALFVADATLEPGSPVIVTSQRIGLPVPRYKNTTKTLDTAPAPAPDMTSQAVLAAQPKSASDAPAKIDSAARETRAEVLPKKLRAAPAKTAWAEAPRQNKSFAQTMDYQQNQFDRFSIKGY
jgi:DsbC/DsbD-like thiol-disulfide interchange protein